MESGGEFQGEHAQLTERIIAVFYAVANELGFGFVESVYRRSMAIALRQAGLKAQEEAPVRVLFRGQDVGTYYADIVVEDLIILELKSAEEITKTYELQLLHYLRSSNMEVGLVLAFGQRAKFRRVVMSNDRKSPNRLPGPSL